LRLKGVGAFPNARRARVIWAGTKEGREELLGLAERVEQACERHGFAREDRPFQGHLTLGRVREPVVNERLACAVGELAEEELGEVAVDRVLLMKSDLTPKGASYTRLEQTLLDERTT
jgi:2'-5' RNA ligase